jgi:hypothetical protein
MRKLSLLLAAASAITLGACSRTKDGDVVVDRPDVDVSTTKDTLNMPTVGTRTDTINAPVMGVQKETLVVNKPVVGTEKKTVKVPVIKP